MRASCPRGRSQRVDRVRVPEALHARQRSDSALKAHFLEDRVGTVLATIPFLGTRLGGADATRNANMGNLASDTAE